MASIGEDIQAPELDQPVLELQASQEARATQAQAASGGGAVVPVTGGGTGAATAATALANLGAAPSNATYITQTASAGLSAEQALSVLATGYMKVTTTTGVVTSLTATQALSDLGLSKNHSGAGAPAVGNDSSQGYSINSIWCDTSVPKTYICQDATAGAAVWTQIAP